MSTLYPKIMMGDSTLQFPMLTVHTNSGDVIVPCEPIGGHFAISPEFGMTDDGQGLLMGTFLVSVYPSGIRLTDGSGCIRCARRAALAWADLPLDWVSLTNDNGTEWTAAQPADALRKFAEYRQLDWYCDAGYCDWAEGDDRSFPMGDTVAI